MSSWLHVLMQFFGLDNGAGAAYLFWSGAGSDLGELTLIGAALSIYWRHNCHVKGCLRIGRQSVEGTSYVVCHKHHPEGAPTHAQVKARHSRSLRAKKTKAGVR